MSTLRRARERARQTARGSAFVGVTAAMLPGVIAAVAAVPDAKKQAVRDAWVRRWAKTLLSIFAIEVVVDGDVPPPGPKSGRLVISNHRSAIDIGVLLSTFGGTMVSRSDLATWPLLGAAARAVGTVFVDRASAKSGAATIRAVQKHLEDGKTIALFPEGTTFDGDEVRPFHGGAFIAAARAEAEIVPVGIAYPKTSGAAFFEETFPSHLARLSKADPTRMVAAIGAPIRLTKGASARQITDRAHADVTSLVARARALCGP